MAYALYNWTKPEARIIVLEPLGASFRTTQTGSLLRIATLRSRHVEAENERMRNVLFERFRIEGLAKGVGDGADFAFQQMRKLPQYRLGSRQHISELRRQQVDLPTRNDALVPLLDLDDPNLSRKLKPEVLETVEHFGSTDSDLWGTTPSALGTLAGPDVADVMYVRSGGRIFEIRWY